MKIKEIAAKLTESFIRQRGIDGTDIILRDAFDNLQSSFSYGISFPIDFDFSSGSGELITMSLHREVGNYLAQTAIVLTKNGSVQDIKVQIVIPDFTGSDCDKPQGWAVIIPGDTVLEMTPQEVMDKINEVVRGIITSIFIDFGLHVDGASTIASALTDADRVGTIRHILVTKVQAPWSNDISKEDVVNLAGKMLDIGYSDSEETLKDDENNEMASKVTDMEFGHPVILI